VLCRDVQGSGSPEERICQLGDPTKSSLERPQRTELVAYCSNGPQSSKEVVENTKDVGRADMWAHVCINPQSPFTVITDCLRDTMGRAVTANFLNIRAGDDEREMWRAIQADVCNV